MAHTVRSERGKVNVGCLLSLLVLAAAVYFALPIGLQFMRYNQIKQEFQTQASFASSTTDQSIRGKVVTVIQEAGLPPDAERQALGNLVVRRVRSGTAMAINIATSYTVTFEVPFYRKDWTFKPSVRIRI